MDHLFNIDIRLYAPLATLCGICVTVLLWKLNQRRKELSYEIVKQESLVSLKGRAKRNLQVCYDGVEVRNASLVVLRIANTGHLPVNPGDYQGRLSVNVGPQAAILSVEVVETSPADLDDRLLGSGNTDLFEKTDNNRIFLRPVLLNDGDSITLQLVVSDLTGSVILSGHIQGIRDIRPLHRKSKLPFIMAQGGALIMAGAMLAVEPAAIKSFQVDQMVPFILLFLLGYVLLFAGISLPKKHGDHIH